LTRSPSRRRTTATCALRPSTPTIAAIIGHDADELLALASRVASDLTDIIRERPREMADFLRAATGLAAEDMARLARQARRARGKIGAAEAERRTMQMRMKRAWPFEFPL